MVTATLRPRGPYSFRLSTRHGSDATRRRPRRRAHRDDRRPTTGSSRCGPGSARRRDPASAPQSEAGVEHVRFVLGLEDDHSEFLRRFADDPLIGEATRRFRGLRPLRTGDRRAGAAPGGRRPADHRRAARARSSAPSIRAATPQLGGLHARADRGRPRALLAGRARAARPRRAARRRARPALRARVDLEALKGAPDRRGRAHGSSASAGSGRGRSASSASRASAATSAGSRATSASSSSPRRCGDGASRPRRPTCCSRRTSEWAGLASVYLLAGYGAGLVGLAMRIAVLGAGKIGQSLIAGLRSSDWAERRDDRHEERAVELGERMGSRRRPRTRRRSGAPTSSCSR